MRYVSIDRRDAIQPAFDALLGVVDEVFPVESKDVHRAKDLVQGHKGLSARDALHAAVMYRHGVDRIVTFNKDFDSLPGIRRVRA